MTTSTSDHIHYESSWLGDYLSDARSWVDGTPTAPSIAGGVGLVRVAGPASANKIVEVF